MIFVDSNIPMYLVGAEHRNKDRAEQLLRRLFGLGADDTTTEEDQA